MTTVRASDGTRFNLLKNKMIERDQYWNRVYFLFREALILALREKNKSVIAGIWEKSSNGALPSSEYSVKYPIQIGESQRHKLFFQIGCMRFVGKERQKLLRWAKNGK